MKTILILCDGMRPDALANIPQAQEMKKLAAYTLEATTVMPSVTLPCHMSLFHSVDPSRHGTTTNTYMPQVRPIDGLCEVLTQGKKNCAFFFDWSELQDLARPGSLAFSYFRKGRIEGYDKTCGTLTDEAIAYIKESAPDFTFLYMGYPDAAGHSYGWMGPEYMESLVCCWKNIEKIQKELEDEYTIIVTADHGGHDRTHGTELPEDMTIPLFIQGEGFEPGKQIPVANIKDIAPTVAKLLQVEPNEEWEGKTLI